jgi:hypothetical protein
LPVDFGEWAHEAGIAIDRTGAAYYVWVDGRRHVMLAVSRDRGQTWSAPTDITPPGVHFASLPGIDVGDPGKLAIVFVATTDRRTTDETTWNGYVAITTTALSKRPVWYAAPVNAPGANPLWIGECGTIRCGSLGDFFDVVIGPDGVARAALVDACPNLMAGNCGTTDLPRGLRHPARGGHRRRAGGRAQASVIRGPGASPIAGSIASPPLGFSGWGGGR